MLLSLSYLVRVACKKWATFSALLLQKTVPKNSTTGRQLISARLAEDPCGLRSHNGPLVAT